MAPIALGTRFGFVAAGSLQKRANRLDPPLGDRREVIREEIEAGLADLLDLPTPAVRAIVNVADEDERGIVALEIDPLEEVARQRGFAVGNQPDLLAELTKR